jgi:prolyl-tRNA editing enzyme YbaK/EbsC (Cys-tRNA(Pro) deacylase)
MSTPGAEHPNVRRVAEAAAMAGLPIEIRRFPEGTRTAEDAARAVGCSVGQIVKSLVFVVDDDAVVALVSGANRLDPTRLAQAVGGRRARRATGEEARLATGFAIGGVPPLGHTRPLTVVVDPDLFAHEVVWAAAGLPDAVFPVRPDELARAAGARRADIALRDDSAEVQPPDAGGR